MINFNVFKFSTARHMAEVEETLSATLGDEEKVNLRDFLKFVDEQCAPLRGRVNHSRFGFLEESETRSRVTEGNPSRKSSIDSPASR